MDKRFNIHLTESIPPSYPGERKYSGHIDNTPLTLYLYPEKDTPGYILDIEIDLHKLYPAWNNEHTYVPQEKFEDRSILHAHIRSPLYTKYLANITNIVQLSMHINQLLEYISNPVYIERHYLIKNILAHAQKYANTSIFNAFIDWYHHPEIIAWHEPSAIWYNTQEFFWANYHTDQPSLAKSTQQYTPSYTQKTYPIIPNTDIDFILSQAASLNIPHLPQPIAHHTPKKDNAYTFAYPPELCINHHNISIIESNKQHDSIPSKPFSFFMNHPPLPELHNNKPTDRSIHHGYLYNTPISITYNGNEQETYVSIYDVTPQNIPYWNERHVYQGHTPFQQMSYITGITIPYAYQTIHQPNDVIPYITNQLNRQPAPHAPIRCNILKTLIHQCTHLYISQFRRLTLLERDNKLYLYDEDTYDDPEIPAYILFENIDQIKKWAEMPYWVLTNNEPYNHQTWKEINIPSLLSHYSLHAYTPLSQHATVEIIRQAQQHHIPNLPNPVATTLYNI